MCVHVKIKDFGKMDIGPGSFWLWDMEEAHLEWMLAGIEVWWAAKSHKWLNFLISSEVMRLMKAVEGVLLVVLCKGDPENTSLFIGISLGGAS